MKRLAAAAIGSGLALCVVLSGAGPVQATMEIQKKTKAAGFDSANCLYCHNEKLPKKGAVTNNDRGKWLLSQKEKRKAKDIDPAWLKEYVVPK